MNHTENALRSDLHGKTAVVTGAAKGIGRAIACQLAAAGADVLVHTRASQQAADLVASEITESGRQAEVVLGDLADEERLREFADRAWNWRERVDIWVNNAGADVLTGNARDWSFDQKLERLWQVDVLATIRLSRLIGQKMLADGNAGAAIVNMSWDQVAAGMGGDSGEMFSAVKGAVAAFSKSLAVSLAPTVRVNCVAPGWIRTAWGEKAAPYWQVRARRESLRDRWGTPEDVAHVVHFLVSPAADFINGQVIPINGGFRSGSTAE